jgi:Na+/proline symporter
MIDSNYIIYLIKEYFALVFFVVIIFNIILRTMVKKKVNKKGKRGHKGGGLLSTITNFVTLTPGKGEMSPLEASLE